MKNILKLNYILLVVATFFIVACQVDDDAPLVLNEEITTVSLGQSGSTVVLAAQNGTVDILLSEALSTTTLVTYTLNGTEQTVEISAGETSAQIPYSLVSPGDQVTVSLTNVTTLYNTSVEIAGNTDYTIILGDENNVVFIVRVPDTSSLAVSLGEFEADGTWVEDPLGFSFGNTFSLPYANTIANSVDIAPNYYAFDIFNQIVLDSAEYEVDVVTADGIQTFTGTLTNFASANSDNPTILVEVSDDPNVAGNKLYSFSQ